MKKYYIITHLVLALSCLFSLIPEVSNIAIVSDAENVTINYVLNADGLCQVTLVVSDDGGATFRIYPTAVVGNVGNSVSPTGRKQIVWNYTADDIESGSNFQVKLIARDNPNEDDDNFLSFTKVKGGTFHNGTADVTISTFFMDKFALTQGDYEAVTGTNPWTSWVGSDYPAYWVTWFDAIKYCNIRSLQEGLTPCYSYGDEGTDPHDWSAGWDFNSNHENYSFDTNANGYRLPTEMEWMYAAKGGNQTEAIGYNRYSGTDEEALLVDYAWYRDNSGAEPHKVGTKEPNQLGLYDMSGNLGEDVWDIFGDYSDEAQINPVGPDTGHYRITRGGTWYTYAVNCQIDNRGTSFPHNPNRSGGFRLARRIDNSPLQITPNPTFSPEAGNYYYNQIITINSGQGRTEIYYTTDGSEPNLTSTHYTAPFSVTVTTTVKARSYKSGSQPSEVVIAEYEIEPIPANFVLVEGGMFYNYGLDYSIETTISSFIMNKYEVTQAEYQAVMGTNPAHNYGIGNTYPAYYISWFNAVKYCNLLSIQEGLDPCYSYSSEGTNPGSWSNGWDHNFNNSEYSCDFNANGYRLPTEMEWMYAAKGGNQTEATGYNQYSGTDEEALLIDYAWYDISPGNSTHPVGTKLPNQLGLYDMSGNVDEWSWDITGAYDNTPQTDPTGPDTGTGRISRGGSVHLPAQACTVFTRGYFLPNGNIYHKGFRVVRSLEQSHY